MFVDLVGPAVGAAAALGVVHLARRRLAAHRAAGVAAGVRTALSCRVEWREGLGRTGFLYGTLTTGPTGGPVFKRPARRAVELPGGGRATHRPSWRPGMRMVEYRAPDGDRLGILVHDTDVDLAARFLRVPDPADYF
ncbi:hypothetical protein [Streptomyces sp. NPDC051577]|uniref:hypothetical protein n=1 Tax=unclassified Streptomyces TaxID=2593676 RepID=UPI00342ACE05